MTKKQRAQPIKWLTDYDDPESVDDLVARNVSLLRIERMSDDAYWMMFEIDGKQYNIDLYVRPGSRAGRTKRRIVAFNRGNLPPARVRP